MKTRTNFQGVAATTGRWALGLSATLLSATSIAQVTLSQSPLFINAAVTPTILMAMDDSGSMDAEILLRNNDGAAWWHTGDQSFVGRGRFDVVEAGRTNYNEVGGANGTWKKYIYLFPNGGGGNGAGRRAYTDDTNDHYAVPPLPAYAYVRSPDFNFSYFNPSTTYAPWPSEGGFTFSNVSPTAAPTDATRGTVTVNLTVDTESTAANHVFRLHQGMTVPAGVRNAPQGGTWSTTAYTATNDNNNNNRRAISYFPAQFYLLGTTALPTCYGYLNTTVTTDGRAPDGTTVLNGYQIRPANFTDACGQTAAQNYQAAIQNFANWFTYYRKRHAAARNALGSGFASFEDFRVGMYRINNRPSPATDLAIRDLFDPTDRTDFFNQAYTELGSGGTPNRNAVDAMRAQLARTDSNAPIRLECQKTFGVLITDGFSNPDGTSVGNRDGAMGDPFEDTHSNTMADIGAALYLDNPRPLLPAGRVPVPAECGLANVPLSVDCNPNLHLNLFGISLGAPGNIFGVDAAATADPYTNPPAWPNPTTMRSPQQIDDLWHATLNSRGEFLSVERPSDLGESFRSVLDSIRDRVDASGSSAAASSAVLQANTRLYNASFRSTDWSGNLVATELDVDDGEPGAEAWSAEEKLAERNLATNPRSIFTSTEAGSAVALDFANLSAAQQTALAVNPIVPASPTATGAERVEWLKGIDDPDLRSRVVGPSKRLLGDIIGSDPQFMSKRDFGYVLLGGAEGTSYRTFRNSPAYLARTDMLFVGANDGMLHAFDATSPPLPLPPPAPPVPPAPTPTAGTEMFAYVPSELLLPGAAGTHAQINDLMRPDYQHRFYVDGSAAVSDAYVDGNWRTMLVGTMGAGGRTVFALDVTDPASFGAANVKWEFKYAANACVADPTGAGGSQACNAVGYGITKPKIVRLASGRWAAVFGNGFNSAGNSARLLVVDLHTGRLLYNLEAVDAANPAAANTAASPNGLSPAETTDWPANQLNLTNAYAGDLKGNMWRFNFAVSPPVVTRLFTATDDASPAVRQPITARPSLAPKPGSVSDLVILFGTGSFFQEGDDNMSAPQRQTLYGVFDNATTAVTNVTRAQLLEQTISSNAAAVTVGTETYAAGTLRFVTENALTDEPGWFIDLPASGERVISEATFPSGALQERVRFATLIPNDDPCGTGRTGFLMDISLLSGGRFASAVFDVSGDDIVGIGDLVGGSYPSGVGGPTGEKPTIVRAPGSNVDHIYGGDGSPLKKSSNTAGPIGRQSWRQLR